MEQARDYRTWDSEPPAAAAASRDPLRVAILSLPQASMANMAAVFEDLQAVNMLPPGPAAGLRFRPRIVAADPRPRRTIGGLMLAPPRGARRGCLRRGRAADAL